MSDARAIQAASLAPGFVNTISDADSAYLQSWLEALVATWAVTPQEFWPDEWEGKFYEPCCPLILALYGYTDSGRYWERMAYDGVKALGWTHVPNRRGTFYKDGPNGRAFLMDLRGRLATPRMSMLSGIQSELAFGWQSQSPRSFPWVLRSSI